MSSTNAPLFPNWKPDLGIGLGFVALWAIAPGARPILTWVLGLVLILLVLAHWTEIKSQVTGVFK